MRRFLSLAAIAAFGLSLSTSPSSAQSAAEIHKKAIEAWLAQPEKERKPIGLPRGTPFAIPDSALEDIRFGFQKRMAFSGHGVLFDAEGRRVELKVEEMQNLQAEMLKAAMQEAEKFRDEKAPGFKQLLEATAKLEEAARSKDFKPVQRFQIRNHLIRAYAYQMRRPFREGYLWRAAFLHHRWIVVRRLKPDLVLRPLDDIIRVWFRDWGGGGRGGSNAYNSDCRDAGVPIPPTFSLTGTPWTKQGELDLNMLSPGERADVFTWADPHKRGGCVALPRWDGADNPSFAGIICQNADNGNACIWDNLPKGSNARIDFETTPLVLDDIADGTELSGCPDCHKGNNAFLIAPDDPTWCRLIRGGQLNAGCAAVTGANSGNFSTAVEGSVRPVTVSGVAHSRFNFLSGTPPRNGWTNNAGAGCGGACHLVGDAGLVNTNNPDPNQDMPPACLNDCN